MGAAAEDGGGPRRDHDEAQDPRRHEDAGGSGQRQDVGEARKGEDDHHQKEPLSADKPGAVRGQAEADDVLDQEDGPDIYVLKIEPFAVETLLIEFKQEGGDAQ